MEHLTQTLTGSQMCLSYWFRLPLCGLKPCSSIAHKAIPAELIDHLPVAEFSDPDDCAFRLFFHPERCFSLLKLSHVSIPDRPLFGDSPDHLNRLSVRLLRSGCHKKAFFTEPPVAHLIVLTRVFKGNYDSLQSTKLFSLDSRNPSRRH